MASSDDITTSQELKAGTRPETVFFEPSHSEPTHPIESAKLSVLPSHVGSYEIGEEIARGGMGIVFRDRDRELNRELAFKVLLCTPQERSDLVRRFLDEAQLAAFLFGELQQCRAADGSQVGVGNPTSEGIHDLGAVAVVAGGDRALLDGGGPALRAFALNRC